jgi:hypothetical protein
MPHPDRHAYPDRRAYPDRNGYPDRFYPIVDSVAWVARLALLGVGTIQLRTKNLSESDAVQTVIDALEVIKGTSAKLVVNDYWRAAIIAGAKHLHLGQEDLARADVKAIRAAGLSLGISTHDDDELRNAQHSAGCDRRHQARTGIGDFRSRRRFDRGCFRCHPERRSGRTGARLAGSESGGGVMRNSISAGIPLPPAGWGHRGRGVRDLPPSPTLSRKGEGSERARRAALIATAITGVVPGRCEASKPEPRHSGSGAYAPSRNDEVWNRAPRSRGSAWRRCAARPE